MPNSDRIEVPPVLGDVICETIEKMTGRSSLIALIILPEEGGIPTVITNMVEKLELLFFQLAQEYALGTAEIEPGSKLN